MKTATGFIGAVVRVGINGKHEVVVSFDTEEQAAKFQNIAYAINCFAGCSTGEEVRIDVPPLADKLVNDDGFMDGIAKTQEEAGIGSHSRGGGKEPSERQVALAKLIARRTKMAMPKKRGFEFRLEAWNNRRWMDISDGNTTYAANKKRMNELVGWKHVRIIRREVGEWAIVEDVKR